MRRNFKDAHVKLSPKPRNFYGFATTVVVRSFSSPSFSMNFFAHVLPTRTPREHREYWHLVSFQYDCLFFRPTESVDYSVVRDGIVLNNLKMADMIN
jgi:hypothetical protein